MKSGMLATLFLALLMTALPVHAAYGTALACEKKEAVMNTRDNITVTVNGTPLTVCWEDNPSVDALADLLSDGPVTIDTQRYGGFEQVGSLPRPIVRSDVQETAIPGDIMLYSGDSIVLFFGSNAWAYTRLGHIEHPSGEELTALLGSEHASAVLALSGER